MTAPCNTGVMSPAPPAPGTVSLAGSPTLSSNQERAGETPALHSPLTSRKK